MLFWDFNIFVCVSDKSACAHMSKGHKREPGVVFCHCSVFETAYPWTWGTCFLDRLETSKPQKIPPVSACFWAEVTEKYIGLSDYCLSARIWTLILMIVYQVLLATESSLHTVFFVETGLMQPRLALNSLCSRVWWLVLIIRLVKVMIA